MKQLKKLSLTLLLLITAAAGAWAQDTYNVTFKANGNTKTVENVTLPKTFSCNWNDETGFGTDELDLIIQELYGLSGGCCVSVAPNSDNASVTCALNGGNQYIIVSAPFNGTATVTGGYEDSNNNGFDYTLEITFADPSSGIEVTTNAASAQDLFTTASFTMPASDVTVNYTLVRDMQDATNPVAFSGLPSSGNIIVKKGDDGKYQPAETLTIQLIDPVAAADAQNIIAADGITIKVLVGAVNGQGAIDYDQDNPITLDAFLADMTPGYYWIKAEPTDENSPYDGTVYSSEFTVAEKYILVVAPANDFSKNGLESVTVGTKTLTPNANGKVKDNDVDPNTEIKLKAKRGYIIEKVESGDYTPAEGHALSESVVGEIIATDGKAYAAADKDDLPAGVTAAAMVAYKNGTSGLAIALTGAKDYMKWDEASQAVAQKPGVAGHTWRLPTMNEWKQMFSANGGSDSKYESLSAAINNAGGKDFESSGGYIWTSTEGSNGAYLIVLYNRSVMYIDTPKRGRYGFRACFSF